jgi:SH3-like domain-containing protein
MTKHTIIILLILAFFPIKSFSEEYPVPRWLSLKGDANMRKGPNINASIKFQYQFKGYPMEVIRQNEEWRLVRDPLTKTEGWMSRVLFNNKRYVITSNKQVNYGYKSANKNEIIAKLAYGVHAKVITCNSSWCHLVIKSDKKTYKMFVEKKNLYGIYNHEIIN